MEVSPILIWLVATPFTFVWAWQLHCYGFKAVDRRNMVVRFWRLPGRLWRFHLGWSRWVKEPMKIVVCACKVPGKLCTSDCMCFTTVFLESGGGDTGCLSSWWFQFSAWKILGRTSVFVPYNGGLLVVSLCKTLFGNCTFSTRFWPYRLDHTSKRMCVHCFLPRGVVLENLFWSIGIVTTSGALTDVRPCLLRWILCFLFFTSSFISLVVCNF
jgi:hypothetical protein